MNIPFRDYWKLLIKYLRLQWPSVLALAMLLTTTIGLQLLNPQLLRSFIDRVRAGDRIDALSGLAVIFFVLTFVIQVLSILATYVGEGIGWTATNMLRTDLVRHCLNLDMPFHHAHTSGEMVERIDGDVTAMANFFSQFMIRVLTNLCILGGVLLLLFWEDWRLGLAFTTYTAVTLMLLNRSRGLATPYWTATSESKAKLYGLIEERISATEDIRSSNAVAYVLRRFYGLAGQVLAKSRKAGLMSGVVFSTTLVLLLIGNTLALGLGVYLRSIGAISVGTIYMIFYYTELIRTPITQILDQIQDLQKASAGIHRVSELLNTHSVLAEIGDAHLPDGPLSVEFSGVSFGYDPATPIICNLALRLEAGQSLGLLGRTGSGKTTIARLLSRLYDVQSGTLLLGGVDIRRVPFAELRQRIGLVTQDIQLFQASVRNNVTFFNPTLSDTRILDVFGELGLNEWYQTLPDGLDTKLDNAVGLSGGQAQLLAFARIFLQNPGLIILDEASSRLDPITEHYVEQALNKLLQNRTVVIIAHRLATVQRVDAIMIMEDGRQVEAGGRTTLAANPQSRFAQLLQTSLTEVLA